jgi:hypothetical protein
MGVAIQVNNGEWACFPNGTPLLRILDLPLNGRDSCTEESEMINGEVVKCGRKKGEAEEK